MAIQHSTSVRNAVVSAVEATIGTAPILKLRTGAVPTNCAAADSGTALVSITLPSDWMNDTSAGSATLKGTWQGTASGTGTAGHYRLYAADGTTCHEQGTVTATGGGGDLTLDNASIASGQQVTIGSFTGTASNA